MAADGSFFSRDFQLTATPVNCKTPRWVVVASTSNDERPLRSERVDGIEATGNWDAEVLIGWAKPRLFAFLARRGWSAEEIEGVHLSVQRVD